MLHSKLSVTDPGSVDLTDLATVKDELAVTDASSDDRLERWISDASGAINTYVGRVLRAQGVIETFSRWYPDARNDGWWPQRGSARASLLAGLMLKRYPVGAVTSVVEDGITLVSGTDYELHSHVGMIYRLNGSTVSPWGGTSIVVTYRGGWENLTDVPGEVRMAVLQLIAYRQGARGRDPSVRSISIPGVMDRSYFGGSAPIAGPFGLPTEVAASLDHLREVRF